MTTARPRSRKGSTGSSAERTSGLTHRQCPPGPSSTGELEEDEEIAREQIRELVHGVFEIASTLDEAVLKYKTRNRMYDTDHPEALDTSWSPTSMCEPMEDGRHALNKLTRTDQWIREEAIGNLRTMKALGRPRMPRKVLTPWQDEESGSSVRSNAEGQSPIQGTSIISDSEGACLSRGMTATSPSEESEEDDVVRQRAELAEKLARHHAACATSRYHPWYENERMLTMPTNIFEERTWEWLSNASVQKQV
jgi:hypothetical protein